MSKSKDQRIWDAAEVLKDALGLVDAVSLARRVLEAADREPTWPSRAVVDEFCDEFGLKGQETRVLCVLRGALVQDPIIKAAIAYRSAVRGEEYSLKAPSDNLIRALDEAGL